MAAWVWTGQREEAAALVAADLLTDTAICERLNIKARDTLWRWKHVPEFSARVAEIKESIRQAVKFDGIAVMDNRVRALNDRWRLLEEVRRARSEEHKDVPGGATGLLTREVQLIKVWEAGDLVVKRDPNAPPDAPQLTVSEVLKTGRIPTDDELEPLDNENGELFSAKRVVEVAAYKLDGTLLREFREVEKQAAQELGQWREKRETQETRRITITSVRAVEPPSKPLPDAS